MKISVIVPVYNAEKYLCECIESIINQTHKDWELLLIDDGSTDSSWEICQRYEKLDERIKAVHTSNNGVVIGRQIGVAHATAEYITFIDSDDSMADTFLSTAADIISSFDPDIIHCGYNIIEDNRFISVKSSYREGFYSFEDMKREIFPSLIESIDGRYFPNFLWGNVYKKRDYENTQLTDVRLDCGEDAACLKAYIANAKSMYVLHDNLYNYRLNLNSVTHTKTARQWTGPEITNRHLAEKINCEFYDFKAQIDRHIVRTLFIVCCTQFNRSQRYNEIKKDIKEYLNKDYFTQAVKKCVFKGYIKGNLAKFALKHRLIYLMKIYNKYVLSR